MRAAKKRNGASRSIPLTGAFGATSPQRESKSRANACRFAAFAHAYAAFRKRNGREA